MEVRQGPGLTLVRNECFMSPAGQQKVYANHTVVHDLRKPVLLRSTCVPITLDSTAETSGSSPRLGPASSLAECEQLGLAARAAVSQSDTTSSMHGEHTMSLSPKRNRPRSSNTGRLPEGRPPAGKTRPGTASAVDRPGSRAGQQRSRPKSSQAYNSREHPGGPKRPQTSMGTRTLGPVTSQDSVSRKRLEPDLALVRTPLCPPPPLTSDFEKQQNIENFLRFISAADSPDDRAAMAHMKGSDSKEPQALLAEKTEQRESLSGTMTRASAISDRHCRKSRWQEIIDLRQRDRVRTTPGVPEPKHIVKTPKFQAAPFVAHEAPRPVVPEAARKLVDIKGRKAGKRLWVDAEEKIEFGVSSAMKMASKLRMKKSRAASKVNEEREYIKALLHEVGRADPLNKNADEWINSFDSLMDKRLKLRQLQNSLAKAESQQKKVMVEVAKVESMLKASSTPESERVALAAQLQALLADERERRIEVAEARTLCDFWTVGTKELNSLLDADKNNAGDLSEWKHLCDQMQEGVFTDDRAEASCHSEVQKALDRNRRGWWQEEFPATHAFDLREDERRALVLDSTEVSGISAEEKARKALSADRDIDIRLRKKALLISPKSNSWSLHMNPELWKKIEARDQILQAQQEWAKRDQETPVWERTGDYAEKRLEDLARSRALYTEIIDQDHLDIYEGEKRISEQKRIRKKQLENSNELWPVLESTLIKKKTRNRTAENERSASSSCPQTLFPAEIEIAAISREQSASSTCIAEVLKKDEADAADDDHISKHKNEQQDQLSDNVGDENEVEVSVRKEDASDVSSSDDEESMARIQEATPGIAYTMIRRLRYPYESSHLSSWQELKEKNEERKMAQVDAYKAMCDHLKVAPVGLNKIKHFIHSQHANDLSVSGLNWGLHQVTAFAGIMKGLDVSETVANLMPVMALRASLDYQTLQHLDCSNNNLGGAGADQLFDCLIESNVLLKSLNISCNNLGELGARAMIELMSMKDSPMEKLVANENHFGDNGSAEMLKMIPALKKLQSLSMSKNQIGLKGARALRDLLGDCKTLVRLDVSWNEIRGPAAIQFANGLKENSTLLSLDVKWNAFGDSMSMQAFADALADCKITEIDLSANRIGAPGSALLADGLERNTDLMAITLDDNPLTMQGIRELLRTASEAVPRTFSFNKCCFARNPKIQYDPAEPAGSYSMDLNDPYSQRVLKNLVRYQADGSGAFDKSSPCVIRASPSDIDGRPFKTDFANENEAVFPAVGLVQFKFLDKRTTTAKDSTMNPFSLEALLSILKIEGVSAADKSDCMQTIIGDNFLSMMQLEEMLKRLGKYETLDRVNLFCHCYHRLADVDDNIEAWKMLSNDERRIAENLLGPDSLGFCPNNATGHYKLDLANAPHRYLAQRLIHLRNEMEEAEASYYKYFDNRGGGKRDISAIGVVWRNVSWNGAPLTIQQTWQVPYFGTLKADFVDIRKPPDEATPMTDEEFEDRILTIWDQKSDLLGLHVVSHATMVKIMHDLSNIKYFTCKQVARMIGRFDSSRDANIRVEIILGCWARTIDYHGLSNVLNLLSPTEQAAVDHRLGQLQTFDEMMAVGFYELDLAVPGQRFVFQELVHLNREPGDSILRLTINQKESELNPEWLAGGIPEEGIVTLFFARSQQTLNKVFDRGAFDHSKRVPTEASKSVFLETYLKEFCAEGFNSPAGEDWIKPFLYRRVRRKLGVKFDTPEHAFYALDDDDGGWLSVKELGDGLRSVGIYMNLHELEEFVSQLDIDGGGKIEIDEIVDFWHKYDTEVFV